MDRTRRVSRRHHRVEPQLELRCVVTRGPAKRFEGVREIAGGVRKKPALLPQEAGQPDPLPLVAAHRGDADARVELVRPPALGRRGGSRLDPKPHRGLLLVVEDGDGACPHARGDQRQQAPHREDRREVVAQRTAGEIGGEGGLARVVETVSHTPLRLLPEMDPAGPESGGLVGAAAPVDPPVE